MADWQGLETSSHQGCDCVRVIGETGLLDEPAETVPDYELRQRPGVTRGR